MLEKLLVIILILGFLVAIFKLKILLNLFKLLRYRFIYLFLVPAVLVTFWVTFSVKEIYKNDRVLLKLTSEFNKKNLENPHFEELTKGEKIKGSFKATENYLGIVSVRFWNFFRLSDDVVIFRIKEQGQSDWFYEYSYKVDQFLANGLFTFGFPVINDSLNKSYDFEVESTAGFKGNAIGLSAIEPAFVATYKYPREFVMSSYSNTFYFIRRKFIELLFNTRFVGSSFIFLMPLLIYLLYLRFNHIKNKSYPTHLLDSKFLSFVVNDKRANHMASMFLVYGALVIDIFWIKRSDLTTLILLLLWIALIMIYKISMHNNLRLALLLFYISYSTWNMGDVNIQFISERALAWAFLFIVLSTLQMIISLEADTHQPNLSHSVKSSEHVGYQTGQLPKKKASRSRANRPLKK